MLFAVASGTAGVDLQVLAAPGGSGTGPVAAGTLTILAMPPWAIGLLLLGVAIMTITIRTRTPRKGRR